MSYRPVPSLPGFFAGSDGSVWYWHRDGAVLRRHKWLVKQTNRWLMSSRGKALLVARVVAEAFRGPCPPGLLCCHNNGDSTDDRPENLRYDTDRANYLDAVRHGSHDPRPDTKRILSPESAREVATAFRRGESRRSIATRLAFKYGTVWAVTAGRRWGHATSAVR